MEMATGARARLTAGACRWPVNALGPVRGAAARLLGMSDGELLIGDGVTAGSCGSETWCGGRCGRSA